MNDAKSEFVEFIRSLIKEEINKMDQTVPCVIQSVNPDNTVNIYLLSDQNTIIPNVINSTRYTFASGDIGILYKIKNRVSNSFIIAKYNAQGE